MKQIILGMMLCASAFAQPSTEQSGTLEKVLKHEGVTFKISTTDNGSLKTTMITPKGLTKIQKMEKEKIDGTLYDAQVADLDGNGFPEVYLFITSASSGSYGSLIAYASNRNKSMTPIYMAPITDDKNAFKGYMGHDRFSIRENRVVREFPIYKERDPNCCPTGGKRTVVYKLISAEAGWQLAIEKMSDDKTVR